MPKPPPGNDLGSRALPSRRRALRKVESMGDFENKAIMIEGVNQGGYIQLK
jgi:hypothetical protein